MAKKKSREILDIEGLSEYLDVSKSTLYKLAQDGKLPGQKVGRNWRFRKDSINKWLDDNTENPDNADNPAEDEKGGNS